MADRSPMMPVRVETLGADVDAQACVVRIEVSPGAEIVIVPGRIPGTIVLEIDSSNAEDAFAFLSRRDRRVCLQLASAIPLAASLLAGGAPSSASAGDRHASASGEIV